MDPITLLMAAFMGLIEGLTEFLPVSSTGHLILVEDLLGFEGPPGKVFDIVIQLGAILAVCVAYFGRLWRVLIGLPGDPGARRFAVAVILAFLPSAVIGALAHGFIKSVLFSPWVVSASLIVGGLAILAIEAKPRVATVREVEDFSPWLALKIGFCQVLAMIPGVSRSGTTILGALLLGVERRAAAEFSFFLAIPTMLGAATYDLYKNRNDLTFDGATVIAIGFVVAFLSALVVIRHFVDFVSRRGFSPFGWYRIAVGTLMLMVLMSR
jgi:undecaprenyl-diphosphatase